MNNQRIRLQALYLVAFWALALAIRLPWPIWVLVAVASGPGLMRNQRPIWRFLLALAATAAAFASVPNPFGVALTAVSALASLSLARQAQPSGDRAAMLTLAIAATAALIRPLAGLAFVPLAGLAVLALLGGQDTNPATERQRIRLATYMAVIAGAGSVIVGLLASLFPWQLALAGIFTALAYPFLKILSLLGPITLRSRSIRRPHVAHIKTRATPSLHHASSSLHVGLVAVVVVLLLIIIYLVYRHFRQDNHDVLDMPGEAGIVRESLGNSDAAILWPTRGGRLTPVRQLVKIRLRAAARRAAGRNPSETLREWLERSPLPHPNRAAVARTYESIRYGNAEDTVDKRREVESHWPKA